MDMRVGPSRRPSTEGLMLLNCGVGEYSWAARRSNQSILKMLGKIEGRRRGDDRG